ncbi:MAG TPA: sugar phosphate isomerase/epimerase [Blastococcus sp.]
MGSSTGMVFAGAPLVVSSYTLGTEVGFSERVRAAAAAGFDGIGLRLENYHDAVASGLDDGAMRAIAEDGGVRVLEVEYLTGWGGDDAGTARDERERTVLHMARVFGVGHVNAGLLEHLPTDVVTESFGRLCDRAGPDLVVALEPMPYSGVRDLRVAWQVVRDAGRANGGLLVDVWHWARSGTTRADLADVPPDRIVSVQLCDVRAEPMEPLRAESLGYRLPPGRGCADAAGVIRALAAHGVRPRIVAVEVISRDLVARGVDVAARTAADAAREVLRAASITGSGTSGSSSAPGVCAP